MLRLFRSILKKWRIIGIVIIIIAAGYFGRTLLKPQPSTVATGEQAKEEVEGEDIVWTCSMHPQIREPEPGLCPICEMELIPVEADDMEDLAENQVSISEQARALADIQTVRTEKKEISKSIRFYGEVDYDETRRKRVSSDVKGRIEEMQVAYQGARVRKGDPLFSIYSPKLINAQEELLQSTKTLRSFSDSGTDKSRRIVASTTAEAARQRLQWWGVTEEQVQEIETTGEIINRLTIKSPRKGVVIEKLKEPGDYVNAGEAVYTIVDLSQVWILLEAYESDLPWLYYGQKITFTAEEALPGRKFDGKIVFIAPELDRTRRTVKLRANAANPEGKLRPGMFVRGKIKARLNAEGRAVEPVDLAGKWISPLYPGIVSDEPGKCPESGVPLVPAEELGYVTEDSGTVENPLVIPASAPLITGDRAIVYVKLQDTDKPVYEGREVKLGPRAGGYYTVLDGLEAGDLVVTKGNFKLDSELQIAGKTSMMSPSDETSGKPQQTWDVEEDFRAQLKGVISQYLATIRALASDDFETAQKAAEKALEELTDVGLENLTAAQKTAWNNAAGELEKALHGIHHADTIENAREALVPVTAKLVDMFSQFGLPPDTTLYRLHCPMAFDNDGADWLFDSEEVRNPYLGSEMPGCGEVEEQLH